MVSDAAGVLGGVAMSALLEVQVSPRRLHAVERAVDAALRRAGKPYRRWVVHVEAPKDGDPFVRVLEWPEVEARMALRWSAEHIAEFHRMRREEHRGDIPQFVCWDGEKTAELWWITPPEGTW